MFFKIFIAAKCSNFITELFTDMFNSLINIYKEPIYHIMHTAYTYIIIFNSQTSFPVILK